MGDDPQWFKIAKSRLGIAEVPGSGSNPTIMDWATQIGVRSVYTADSVPWCGLFVGSCMKAAGYKPVAGPLSARSWIKFGKPLQRPSPGAILIFPRGSNPVQGHVCFYVSENETHYHVLGGNQGDRVCYAKYRKGNLLAARWPDGAANPEIAEVIREFGEDDVEPGPDEVFEQRIKRSYGNAPAGTITSTVVYTNFETGETETVAGDPTGGSGKKTARVGDPCTHGAVVKTGSPTRSIEGKAVARIDDLVDCPIHGVNKIVSGSSDTFLEGKGVAYVGSVSECGAEILDGASTVFTN